MAVQDAVSQDTTLVRLKDIETDPIDQATLDRATSSAITSARIDFGGPIVSTTVWDIFGHTIGLDANETLAHTFRTNGSSGAYTTVATVTADNTRVELPDNATGATGSNARDFQFQWTLALSAVTDSARVLSLDIGYNRAWPIRYVHVQDVLTDVQVMGAPPPDVILTNIATILALNTKGTLVYSGQTYYTIPTNESEINEVMADLAGQRRAGTVRLWMLEP